MGKDSKTEILRVRISKSDKEKLRYYSRNQMVTMSELVRQMIKNI